MENKIKTLRIQLDELAQLTKNLKNDFINDDKLLYGEDFEGFPTEETKHATDSLFLAKAWLGKMLELLGSKTPYINDGNRKTVSDIEPTAERKEFRKQGIEYEFIIKNNNPVYWKDLSYIEKVDWIREEIKQIIDNTEDFSENIDYIELEQGFVYKHLCEARFWLGWELGRIRDEK